MTPEHRQNEWALMKRVEELVREIESTDDAEKTVTTVVEGLIASFEDELGVFGGRLYRSAGEGYELRGTFGKAKSLDQGIFLPKTYPPIAACLVEGTVYRDMADADVDPLLEKKLGVEEFACLEVAEGAYILAFDVAPGHDRTGLLFSMSILRHAINSQIRQEKMNEVFRQASQIQSSILPKSAPSFSEFDLAGKSIPLESVGGDFFDWIPFSEKSMGIVLADVSGHGLPAALQVRDIYMGLRMAVGRQFKMIHTIERLNQIIHQAALTSRFVALIYGELEACGNFIYTNAGHLPPLLMRANGSIEYLRRGGVVLGPLGDASYERGFVEIQRGDILMAFTDGIVETHRPSDQEEFGEARLVELVENIRHEPAQVIVDAIFKAVEAFGESKEANDDRTVIVIKR